MQSYLASVTTGPYALYPTSAIGDAQSTSGVAVVTVVTIIIFAVLALIATVIVLGAFML